MRNVIFVLGLWLICAYSSAYACGNNTPEQLRARAQGKFNAWDINKNKLFEPEEFLAADNSYINPKAKNAEWVSFYKDMLIVHDEFLKADADQSGALTFDEWLTARPPEQFLMNKGGC